MMREARQTVTMPAPLRAMTVVCPTRGEDRDEEVTRLYNQAMLPRPMPPPVRLARATIPDVEEDITDDAVIVDDEAPAFSFVKRTCVLDDSELEVARNPDGARGSLFVPTPREVLPTVLSAQSARRTSVAKSRTTVWAIVVLVVSAGVGSALSYSLHAGLNVRALASHSGPQAIAALRYALAL